MAVAGANGSVAGGLLTVVAACLAWSGVSSDGRRVRRRWRRGWVPRATMIVFEVQSQSRPSLAEADGGYEVLGGDRVGCGVID